MTGLDGDARRRPGTCVARGRRLGRPGDALARPGAGVMSTSASLEAEGPLAGRRPSDVRRPAADGRIDDDLPVRDTSRSDVRAIAAAAVGLALVSLVGLASGGSPWRGAGGGDVPVEVVRALATAGSALVVGSLLLVWAATPPTERRGSRRRRPVAGDLEGIGASLSAAGKTAVVVGGAIGVLMLVALPLFVSGAPNRADAPSGGAPSPSPDGTSSPSGHPTSISLTWLAVGSAVALLVAAPAALAIRRRSARLAGEAVAPDAAELVGSGLRRSLGDLESERDVRLAVERAYARMEASLGAVELSRAPAETPAEFTARLLRVLGASAAAASDLTGLFEVARFSDHAMDEQDRRRAILAVRTVEREIASR